MSHTTGAFSVVVAGAAAGSGSVDDHFGGLCGDCGVWWES